MSDEKVYELALDIERRLTLALARLAEAERDAARYRWLRDSRPDVVDGVLLDRDGEWDAAIDLAIAASAELAKVAQAVGFGNGESAGTTVTGAPDGSQ
jgi:hypothetical protein